MCAAAKAHLRVDSTIFELLLFIRPDGTLILGGTKYPALRQRCMPGYFRVVSTGTLFMG